MRRLFIAVTAATLAVAPGIGGAQESDSDGGQTAEELCQEYCGEKAAERCDDLDSFRCGAYILGCLAGCGMKHL